MQRKLQQPTNVFRLPVRSPGLFEEATLNGSTARKLSGRTNMLETSPLLQNGASGP